jgi:hypothetical protein
MVPNGFKWFQMVLSGLSAPIGSTSCRFRSWVFWDLAFGIWLFDFWIFGFFDCCSKIKNKK